MLRKLRVILTLAIGILPYSSTYANPDETTRQLMTEPASVFDVGMLRLQLELNQIKKAVRYPKSFDLLTASYIWNKDQVVIFTGPINAVSTIEDAKSGCKEAFREIRNYALVNDDTGKVLTFVDNSNFSGFFSHNGYSVSKIQGSLAEFDKKFVLKCRCPVRGGEDIKAEAPLLSNKIFFEG